MSDNIPIPDEPVEAACIKHYGKNWEKFKEEWKSDFRHASRAALSAALKAWPGMWQQHITSPTLNRPYSLILPLTEKEPTNG